MSGGYAFLFRTSLSAASKVVDVSTWETTGIIAATSFTLELNFGAVAKAYSGMVIKLRGFFMTRLVYPMSVSPISEALMAMCAGLIASVGRKLYSGEESPV